MMIGEPQAIGRVIAVSGSKIRCLLSHHDGPSPSGRPGADEARVNSSVQIGSLVKAITDQGTVYGLVSNIHVEDLTIVPSKTEKYIAEIDLYGQIRARSASDSGVAFERGISRYPGLGDPVFAADDQDLERVYARPQKANIRVGKVLQGNDLSAYLVTDDLLGKHFAILGTTGGGKSCSLVLVLRAILDAHPNGHIVLLDPHDEYAHCFGDVAEVINLDNLELPYWLLDFDEMVAVFASHDGRDHEIEADILRPAVLAARRLGTGSQKFENVTVDTPVPFRLAELIRHIDQAMGKLDKPDDSRPYLRLKARLDTLMSDKRFSFMFGSPRIHDTMAEVLSRLFRIPNRDKPISIIDLSGIPADIVDVVVSLLCRLIFDFAVWSENPETHPMLLVCEEAHRYIPSDETRGFGPTKAAIARIAKEGRKYGVSLGLVTQRPSEISPSVLSQCNTVIAMRMSNEQDQDFVRRALPENALGLLNALPSLQTREAVAIGEGAPIPVRFMFDVLPPELQPRSARMGFAEAWGRDQSFDGVIEETVRRWRRQRFRPRIRVEPEAPETPIERRSIRLQRSAPPPAE